MYRICGVYKITVLYGIAKVLNYTAQNNNASEIQMLLYIALHDEDFSDR